MFSLVFEMLDAPKAFERAIDHDGQTSTEGLTFFHTVCVCVHVCGKLTGIFTLALSCSVFMQAGQP